MAIHYIDFTSGEDKEWAYTISGATRANPCVLTIMTHKFNPGDRIRITSVAGMTQLNNNQYDVTAITATTVTINVNSSAFGVYTSGGTATAYKKIVTGITQANPAVVSCNSHGYSDGQQIWFRDVIGMTQLNNNVYTVANATTDTFELLGIDSTSYGAYSSGGYTARPYLTSHNQVFVDFRIAVGDTVRVAKTAAPTSYALGNATWTAGSADVATAVSYAGSLSVGDYIGTPSAAGNGADETYYCIRAISATTISLEGRFAGTTGTFGSIKKLNPVGAGGSAQALLWQGVQCSLSGGWTLSSTPTQDGETWLKHNFSKTVNTNIGLFSAAGADTDRINVTDAYYGAQPAGTVTNCTFVGGYVYSVYVPYTSVVLTNCRIGHNGGPSWASLQLSTGSITLNNCVVNSYYATYSSAITMSVPGSNIDFSTCTIKSSGYGINISAQETYIYAPTISLCNYGFNLAVALQSGTIDAADVSSCFRGIYTGSTNTGLLVKNSTFDQCTTGIYCGQLHNSRFEGNIFSNNNYDIEMDTHSGSIYSINNSHITPTTRAYQRTGSCGPIYIINCTIDAGSTAKTFLQTTNSNNMYPQFYVQDSFFGQTGQYFGKLEVVKNTGTVPPSVQLRFNTTVNSNYSDQKIASTYAKGGVAKTLGFKLTAVTAGWAGTLVPKIKLNGATIQTETTISSVSYGSDDTYSYVVPGGSITADGELSIEVTPNANNVAILVKEFTVT